MKLFVKMVTITLDIIENNESYNWYTLVDDLISYEDRLNCNYILPKDFISVADPGQSRINFFGINVRSLNAHFHSLEDLLEQMVGSETELDVIALTEIFKCDLNNELNLANYHPLISKVRPADNRGGVGLFIRKDYEIQQRADLSVFIPNVIETQFVQITKRRKSTIVGVIYRPNSPPLASVTVFINELQNILDKIDETNGEVCLLGDFNIDLLRLDNDHNVNRFLEMMVASSFLPTISKPTRVADQSATLIDQIFIKSNEVATNLKSGIILTDITDHFGIFLGIGQKEQSINKQKLLIKKRKFNEKSIESLCTLLQYTTFEEVYQANNPENAYNIFLDIFMSNYNLCFPLEEITIPKKYIKKKPWMTKGLIISSITKQNLYKKKLKQPHQYLDKYKIYCQIYYKLIKFSKNMYFKEKFNN